jgi:hypothetical protein
MTMRSIFLAVFLIAAATGCKSQAEREAEKKVEETMGGQAKIDEKTGSVEVKTKDENGKETAIQFGPNSKVPDDFPKAVPIYPGAKIMSTVSLAEGKNGHLITLQTDAEPPTVIEYYKKNLVGFKTDSELGSGTESMLMMSNAELSVSISITKSEGDTLVQLTVSRSKV